MGKHPDVKKEHLRSLRRVICGAAPLSATDAEAILGKSEVKISPAIVASVKISRAI